VITIVITIVKVSVNTKHWDGANAVSKWIRFTFQVSSFKFKLFFKFYFIVKLKLSSTQEYLFNSRVCCHPTHLSPLGYQCCNNLYYRPHVFMETLRACPLNRWRRSRQISVSELKWFERQPVGSVRYWRQSVSVQPGRQLLRWNRAVLLPDSLWDSSVVDGGPAVSVWRRCVRHLECRIIRYGRRTSKVVCFIVLDDGI